MNDVLQMIEADEKAELKAQRRMKRKKRNKRLGVLLFLGSAGVMYANITTGAAEPAMGFAVMYIILYVLWKIKGILFSKLMNSNSDGLSKLA